MATVNIYLDSRKSTDGKGVLKLLVSHNRTPRLYTTETTILKTDYDKLKAYGNELDKRVKDKTLSIYTTFFMPKKTIKKYSLMAMF